MTLHSRKQVGRKNLKPCAFIRVQEHQIVFVELSMPTREEVGR